MRSVGLSRMRLRARTGWRKRRPRSIFRSRNWFNYSSRRNSTSSPPFHRTFVCVCVIVPKKKRSKKFHIARLVGVYVCSGPASLEWKSKPCFSPLYLPVPVCRLSIVYPFSASGAREKSEYSLRRSRRTLAWSVHETRPGGRWDNRKVSLPIPSNPSREKKKTRKKFLITSRNGNFFRSCREKSDCARLIKKLEQSYARIVRWTLLSTDWAISRVEKRTRKSHKNT